MPSLTPIGGMRLQSAGVDVGEIARTQLQSRVKLRSTLRHRCCARSCRRQSAGTAALPCAGWLPSASPSFRLRASPFLFSALRGRVAPSSRIVGAFPVVRRRCGTARPGSRAVDATSRRGRRSFFTLPP